MCEKVQGFWESQGLENPRWSGEERIHLKSKTWHDSCTSSEVSGGLYFQLLKIYVEMGEFKGAEKVFLDCQKGQKGDKQKRHQVIAFVYLATL